MAGVISRYTPSVIGLNHQLNLFYLFFLISVLSIKYRSMTYLIVTCQTKILSDIPCN